MTTHVLGAGLALVLAVWFVSACGTLNADAGRGGSPTPDVPAAAPPEEKATPTVAVIAQGAPSASLTASTIPTETATADIERATLEPTATREPALATKPAVLPSATALPAQATDTPVPASTATDTPAPCEYQWFLPRPPEACPEAGAVNSFAASQRFERGQLIWIETLDYFFLLFESGAHPLDSRRAYRTLARLRIAPGGSVDNRVGETPPPGYQEPISGFGLIWRNEVHGLDTDVRAALGWAREAEFGFTTAYQCRRPTTYSSRSCYLRDPEGRVIALDEGAYVGYVWSRLDP